MKIFITLFLFVDLRAFSKKAAVQEKSLLLLNFREIAKFASRTIFGKALVLGV